MPKSHLYWILVTFLVSVFSAWCADPYAGTFRYVMRKVRDRAIRPLSERELFDAGLAGLLASVDENSSYIPPRRYEKLNQEFTQEIGSVGLLFYQTAASSKTWVGATLPRSAARLGGVLPGDEIIAINGVTLKNASFEEVSVKLQAPVGTEVSLELFRPSTQKKFSVLLVSQRQTVPSVTGFVRQNDGMWNFRLPQFSEGSGQENQKILYVHIENFGEKTVGEMRQILRQGVAENADGLVLDLTGNGGGLLDAGIGVCGMFLPESSKEKYYPCVWVAGAGKTPVISSEKRIWTKPVVVLIDRNTASAAEILAACLQDYGENGIIQAICVGERTYGKGTIQEIFDLGPIPDDRRLENENDPRTLWEKIWQKPVRGGVRISTAMYLSPNGRVIHRFPKAKKTDEWGVFPNPGWNVNPDAAPYWKTNKNQAETDRLEFDRLRFSGALPKEQWGSIYDFDPVLKRAAEVFNDVPKNFSPKASDQ